MPSDLCTFHLFQSITSKRTSTMTAWTKLFLLFKLTQSQAHLGVVFLSLAHLYTEPYLHSTSSSTHRSFCSLLRHSERKTEFKQKILLNHGRTVAGLHHITVDLCHNNTSHLFVKYSVSCHPTALRQFRLSL